MISVPDDKGRVAVLYPSTGEFKVLQSEGMEHIKTVPVWRYPNDLCYINGYGRKNKKEADYNEQVVLRTATEEKGWSEPRPISKSWPSGARNGWLE